MIDLYELVAAQRGLRPDELPLSERIELGRRALEIAWPGFETTAGSDRGTEPIELRPYDSVWPVLYAHWHARLAAALGETATRIDHIGSTAVPGLAAKPTVDIQVSVANPAHEAGYGPQLDALGLQLRSRDTLHRYFRPLPGRPRSVHVHVCEACSMWEREHLLLRDYLRSHQEARERYARAKRDAAALWRDDRIAYTDAKTDFVLNALAAAESWARATAWSP